MSMGKSMVDKWIWKLRKERTGYEVRPVPFYLHSVVLKI